MKFFSKMFLIAVMLFNQNSYGFDENIYDEIIIPPQINKEEFKKELLEGEKEVIFEEPIILEEEKIPLQIEKNDFALVAPNGLLSDKLTLKFKKGLIKENKTELMTFYGFTQTIDKKDSDFDFDVLFVKLGFLGKLRSDKEKYVVTFNLTPGIHQNFFKSLPLDTYIESSRIKNHKVKIGTFRPNLGYEGAQALFLIPILYKTQIARNLSDMRKTGLSFNAEYKYLDYFVEGFSSDTQYREFFPGSEGNLWIDFKPLAKFDEKYGKLKIGSGFNAGKKHSNDYSILSAALRYDYKKFWLLAEFADADGSNGGDGFNKSKRQGYNITLCYAPIPKLELLLRYDDFDNDKKIKNNNTKEYTAGFNYYIYNEAIVLMVNYTYFQDDIKPDSHRFIVGAQILI